MSTTPNTLEILRLVASGATHEAVQEWAAASLRNLATGAQPDRALRIDRGQRVRERNRQLSAAWEILAADGATSWTVAGRLAVAIKRHKTTSHRAWLAGVNIRTRDELEAALHCAFSAGAGMVYHQRRLHDLLTK